MVPVLALDQSSLATIPNSYQSFSAGFVPALLDLIRVGCGIIDSLPWVDLVFGFIPRENGESFTIVALGLSVPHVRLAAGAGIDKFAVCAGCTYSLSIPTSDDFCRVRSLLSAMECFRSASGIFATSNTLPISSIRGSSAVDFGAEGRFRI